MTIEYPKSFEEARAEWCVIGEHPLSGEDFVTLRIDGHPLCDRHFVELTQAADQHHNRDWDSVIISYRRQHLKREREDAKAERVRKARRNQPGFVYYIRMDDLIKIGYAADVARRMRAYPPSAELLAVHPGTPAVEARMHEDFRAFLRRGREWFEPSREVMAHVDKVRMRFGDAKRFAYEYSKPV